MHSAHKVIGLLCLVGLLTGCDAFEYLSKPDIIYKVVVHSPAGETLDEQTMAETLSVLGRRFNSHRPSFFSAVKVSQPDQFYRLHLLNGAPDADTIKKLSGIQGQLRAYSNDPTAPWFTEKDIAIATLAHGENDSLVLELSLKPKSAKQFRKAIAAAPGQPLVIAYDGNPLLTTTTDANSEPYFHIPMTDREQALWTATLIKTGALTLPVSLELQNRSFCRFLAFNHSLQLL